ncbi:alpha/beta hydrolase family protein [Ahniella affigens]|nr:alpha/beta fold hydrolase [Ahniella affigens]
MLDPFMVRLVLVFGLLLTGLPVGAHWVQPGEPVSLKDNEGLLALVIDSDAVVSSVRLDKIGNLIASPKLEQLSQGRYLRLLKLDAAEYRVNELVAMNFGRSSIIYEIGDIPSARFKVEAGKINYAGDLVSRGISMRSFRMANRNLSAYVTVQQEYPGLIERFPWRHAMAEPDPYFDFWQTEQAAQKEPSQPVSALPALTPRSDSVAFAKQMFRYYPDRMGYLSPDGLALVERVDNEIEPRLRVYWLSGDHVDRIELPPGKLLNLVWIANRRFVAHLSPERGGIRAYTVDIGGPPPYSLQLIMPTTAMLISVDPDGSGLGYFAALKRKELKVYRVDTRLPPESWVKKAKAEVLKQIRDEVYWWADEHGRPRLAWQIDDEGSSYQLVDEDGKGRAFSVKTRTNESITFVGFTRDGRLLAITNIDRPQQELVEFDQRTLTLGRTVFAKPGQDVLQAGSVDSTLVDFAVYRQGGHLRQHYLNATDAGALQRIQAEQRNKSVLVGPATGNANRLVYVEAGDSPPTMMVYDAAKQKLVAPQYELKTPDYGALSGTERFVLKRSNGQSIEGFLTRSSSRLPSPLVVMPHGGPIGAYDADTFDQEVQYLARMGFAVLRVNYRGSGNATEQALAEGVGQFGTGIEDDINDAVDYALTLGGVDARRVVALGTSYGGYSAVMLTLRWPERYLASVAIAAPFDLCLMMSDADFVGSQATIEVLRHWIGGDRGDAANCRDISPVYRYRELKNPMLVVHDYGDERVTYQHVQRMIRMTKMIGRPVPVLTLKSNEHGVVKYDDQVQVWPKIVTFLNQVLADKERVSSAPVALKR